MEIASLAKSQSSGVKSGLTSRQITQSISLCSLEELKQPHPANLQEIVIVGGGAAAAQILNEMNLLNASSGLERPYAGQVCVVAKADAWDPSQRGMGFINHQHELIAHYGDQVPEYDPSYTDRAAFSTTNEAIIQQAVEKGAYRIRHEVSRIERLADGNFRLYFLEGSPVDAKRVVLATGLGKDVTFFDVPTLPGGRTQLQKKMENMRFPNQTVLKQQGRTLTGTELSIALDQHPDQFKGKQFVFQGSFAIIDAIEKLKATLGETVNIVAWLVRESAPNFLDGHALKYAPAVSRDKTVFVSQVEVSPLTPDHQRTGIAVNAKLTTNNLFGQPEERTLIADYYVYALGSDPELPGSGQAMLGDLMDQLQPLYDFNQTISEKPYETVLGLEISGNDSEQGLTIVGAAATALATKVKHNYLQQVKAGLLDQAKLIHPKLSKQLAKAIKNQCQPDVLMSLVRVYSDQLGQSGSMLGLFKVVKQNVKRFIEARRHIIPGIDTLTENVTAPRNAPTVAQAMNKINKTQVASVVSSAQLCTVRAAISGLTAMIAPYHAQGEINYSVDNRTQMRVAIAQKYEQIDDLPQRQVEKFIADVTRIRSLESSAFVEYASHELINREVMPLIYSSRSMDEIVKGLTSLNISPATCEKCSNHLLFARTHFIGVSLSADLLADLKNELMAAFKAGPKPVHGTPEYVRAGYEHYLRGLQNKETKNTSLAKYWLM